MNNPNLNQLNQLNDFSNIMANFSEHYADYAKQFSLNINELSVLYSLWTQKQCTQKAICRDWVLPKQTVNTICKNYVADGFIIILENQNPADKREKLLTLTDKGNAFAKPIIEPLLGLENACLAEFGTERMAKFINEFNALEKLFLAQLTQFHQSNQIKNKE